MALEISIKCVTDTRYDYNLNNIHHIPLACIWFVSCQFIKQSILKEVSCQFVAVPNTQFIVQ